jgi:chemotaxis protein methyltransferase CheR
VTLSADDLAFVADLVHRRAAIVLDASKEYLVVARLTPVARRASTTIDGLIRDLRRASCGPLHVQVVEALTTNETSFFRDFHPWEALTSTVIPDLLTTRRSTRRLTVWCAACSSGQEPYTIAMVLSEQFPELAGWTVRIAGTDISTQMVTRTTEAFYSDLEVNRGLPPPLRTKYFARDGDGWRVRPDLRRMVTASHLNLAEPWGSLGAVDVVFMRNVLIYFDVATRRTILERVARLLPPDGSLFLGAAETTINLTQALTRDAIGATSIYRPTTRPTPRLHPSPRSPEPR